jgi:hypothetical protein
MNSSLDHSMFLDGTRVNSPVFLHAGGINSPRVPEMSGCYAGVIRLMDQRPTCLTYPYTEGPPAAE